MRLEPAPRSNGNVTRGKILDAAEALFGARGFDAVSLRDITVRAGVTLALASYHYGTKEQLFSAVIERRAEILCDMRRARLHALGPMPDVEALLDAFMGPLFDQVRKDADGWPMYVRVLTRLGEDDRWSALLAAHFDPVAQEFIEALERALPAVDRRALRRAFIMSLQLMLETLARRRRLDELTGGSISGDEIDEAYPVLLRFVSGGMNAL